MMRYFTGGLLLASLMISCSASRHIRKTADSTLFSDSVLQNAHVGIAIYDPEKKKYLYQHQADRFFTPASNTKIVSLYAGLKYLPALLDGAYYQETTDSVFIQPTGDPTLLHPDFTSQPVFDFIKSQTKPIGINEGNWGTAALGNGWSWSDYGTSYMVERSPLPVYGNVIRWTQTRDSSSLAALVQQEAFVFSEPDIDWKVRFNFDTAAGTFSVKRSYLENEFFITQGKETHATREVAFITNGLASSLELLSEASGKSIRATTTQLTVPRLISSQPADSMLKKMMERSDNFYAEQTLLMAAGKKFGTMNERRMIQHLLANELKDFPQFPVWVDGSGLSRYNLFTPLDFVWILNKMQHEYGMERMKVLFPAGGAGTLKNYYISDIPYIFAKTGTLSGVVSLSGYLYTRSGKLLIFSFLVNNCTQPAASVRKKVETFLTGLR